MERNRFASFNVAARRREWTWATGGIVSSEIHFPDPDAETSSEGGHSATGDQREYAELSWGRKDSDNGLVNLGQLPLVEPRGCLGWIAGLAQREQAHDQERETVDQKPEGKR